MIPIKIADYIIKFLLVVALLLIGLSTSGKACEVFNYDTSECELMNEQSFNLNLKWEEFFTRDSNETN